MPVGSALTQGIEHNHEAVSGHVAASWVLLLLGKRARAVVQPGRPRGRRHRTPAGYLLVVGDVLPGDKDNHDDNHTDDHAHDNSDNRRKHDHKNDHREHHEDDYQEDHEDNHKDDDQDDSGEDHEDDHEDDSEDGHEDGQEDDHGGGHGDEDLDIGGGAGRRQEVRHRGEGLGSVEAHPLRPLGRELHREPVLLRPGDAVLRQGRALRDVQDELLPRRRPERRLRVPDPVELRPAGEGRRAAGAVLLRVHARGQL
mmetsp:Transcript_81209/g.230074  ORF Transcript_81209/g.230074 Transcript_81209/m.230074 type:complete len:255 (-) Transcript_81209:562-1326(-)